MSNDPTLSRRDFFKSSFKSFGKNLKETAVALYSSEETYSNEPELIRPPGALPNKEFLEKCTRCNECVKVCPEESILKFVDETSPHHLTPIVALRKSPCVLCEDFPCVKVCEPKALIKPKSPQDVKMGTAVINEKLCLAWQNQDCDYCVKECPIGGKAIYLDDSQKPHVAEEHCTGCGACEYICPSRQAAIVIKKNV